MPRIQLERAAEIFSRLPGPLQVPCDQPAQVERFSVLGAGGDVSIHLLKRLFEIPESSVDKRELSAGLPIFGFQSQVVFVCF